jgi:hypothetical protein
MTTEVVNLYKEPYDVYIGRKGKGQDGYFGNPHIHGSRDDNIKMFEKYFYDRLKRDPKFRKRVHELRGKRLGCFCKPKRCHGDVIAKYLNDLPEPKPVKIAIVGSRTFNDYRYLCETLEWFDVKKVVSGGAKGADKLAEKWAAEHGIPVQVFHADWDRYGKAAGYKRNLKIVEACDEVIAFWDGKSKGTKHTIDIAENEGKPVYILGPRIREDDISMLG